MIASLWVWADPDKLVIEDALVEMSPARSDLIASLWVWADPLNAESPATYSALNAAAEEPEWLLNAVDWAESKAALCAWAEPDNVDTAEVTSASVA